MGWDGSRVVATRACYKLPMVPLRPWARAVALLASLSACSAETPSEPAPSSASAAAAAAAGGPEGAVQAQCTPDPSVDAATREALSTRAQALLASLREADDDALWGQLHPQAQQPEQRQAFLGALASMRERLAGTEPPEVERIDVIDVRGGSNSVVVVQCGADDDPGRFTLMTNAGSEPVAVVSLRSAGPSGALATTVQLRERGDQWRLLGLHASPSTYRGRGPAAYESMADAAMGRQQVVVAHTLLSVAKLLSDRGASLETDLHDRVTQKLAAIERDQLFAAETATWSLGEARFRIQGLSLVATADGMSPVFEYVSPQGLVKDLLDRDADALIGEVRRRFPGLSQHFDAVVFEAYAEVPNEPGKSYQAYRMVRLLDPTQRRG